MELEEKPTKKQIFLQYIFILVMLISVFAIMFVVIYFPRNIRNNMYLKTINTELNEYYNETGIMYQVSDSISIDKKLDSNFKLFSCYSDSESGLICVLVRITTIYGPIPGIFIYNPQTNNCDFIKFINTSKKSDKTITENSISSQIYYWNNKIPAELKDIN